MYIYFLDVIPAAETFIMKIDVQGFECRVRYIDEYKDR